MKKNIITFVVIFLAINFIVNLFFKPPGDNAQITNEISIQPLQKEFEIGSVINAEIKNSTTKIASIKNECPEEPLTVLMYSNGQWVQKSKKADIPCANKDDVIIKPGEKHLISYSGWNQALFGELGRYKLQTTVNLTPAIPGSNQASTQQDTTQTTSSQATQAQSSTQQVPAQTTEQTTFPQNQAGIETKTIESPEFEVKPQGTLGYLWTTLFYQPLYNTLIYLVSIAPAHDLGLAIILLTIIIRTILLVPSQNALKSQRKLQEVQPKLKKIREQYKDNQEMVAKETMAIWKEHKVNPFGSCLPLLIQFPVLIALFYAVQNGLNPDNAHLLYGSLKDFPFNQINVNFLNILDLTKINFFILPLIVGGLQFLQMKLATINVKKNKKKEAEKGHPLAQNKTAKKDGPNEMEMANNLMVYIMPLMIAIFTASVPAGVGLYWIVSTLYGIGQQLIVNKQSNKDKVKVKVLPDPK